MRTDLSTPPSSGRPPARSSCSTACSSTGRSCGTTGTTRCSSASSGRGITTCERSWSVATWTLPRRDSIAITRGSRSTSASASRGSTPTSSSTTTICVPRTSCRPTTRGERRTEADVRVDPSRDRRALTPRAVRSSTAHASRPAFGHDEAMRARDGAFGRVGRAAVRTVAALLLALATAACGGDEDASQGASPAGPPPPPGGDPRFVPSPRLAGLAKTDVAGFARKGDRATSAAATPWYEALEANATGWRVVAVVTFRPCAQCKPLDLATWRGHEQELRGVLPDAHRADPALVFDLFEVDLGSRLGIALEKRSVLAGREGSGDASSVVDGLSVFFNDGRDEIVLDLTARGPADAPAATSVADLVARVPRADYVRAARAVFAAFEPAFR